MSGPCREPPDPRPPEAGIGCRGHREVVVVGAGPAGAVVALELARRGRDVLLVERREWPREKVCGGCLSGATLDLLARCGLRALIAERGALPLSRLRLGGWGRGVELDLPAGVALSRRALDDGLVAAARDAGATFLPGTTARVGAVDESGDHRTVELCREGRPGAHRGAAVEGTAGDDPDLLDGVVRARVVVAAAGLGGSPAGTRSAAGTASAVDGMAPERTLRERDTPAGEDTAPGSGRVGLGTVLPAAPGSALPGSIHMAVGSAGYVGGVLVEDGRWNLAAAVDPAPLRELGPGGVVAGILDQAGFEPPAGLQEARWKGTPALTRRGRLAARRLVAIGDAAGYVEPFTGEGILWALRGARLAAPLVDRGVEAWTAELEVRWRRTYHRRIRRDQRWCRRLAWLLASPARARLALSVVCRLPGLATPLVRQLAPAPTTPGGMP